MIPPIIHFIPISHYPVKQFNKTKIGVHIWTKCQDHNWNNQVPPNQRTEQPIYLLCSPPNLTMDPRGRTRELLLSYSPSSVLEKLLLASHFENSAHNNNWYSSFSPAYFAASCLLPYAMLYMPEAFVPRSFSPWEFSQLYKSLIFRGFQWPNSRFSTCNIQPWGSSNIFPTHGVMVSWFQPGCSICLSAINIKIFVS